MGRVSVVRWGSVDEDEPRIYWGLKVGPAYVCHGREPAFYATRPAALEAARELRAALQSKDTHHD